MLSAGFEPVIPAIKRPDLRNFHICMIYGIEIKSINQSIKSSIITKGTIADYPPSSTSPPSTTAIACFETVFSSNGTGFAEFPLSSRRQLDYFIILPTKLSAPLCTLRLVTVNVGYSFVVNMNVKEYRIDF
jgi:hypothetical protein